MSDHVFVIERSDIEKRDVTRCVRWFERFNTPEAILSAIGEVTIAVSGYDDDPRELYTIADVRAYFALLDTALPHILLFLSPSDGTLQLWFFLRCDVTKTANGDSIDLQHAQSLLGKSYPKQNDYLMAAGVNPLSDRIVEHAMMSIDALMN